MIVYKCKMCGGDLNVSEGSKVAVCEYCQTKQTVPTVDSEKLANMYNRANYFRQNSEFDKAMEVYERILDENPSDSEAYWAILLCRYGIEYVEDPATGERKPTVNRTQAQSIFKDSDYLMAIEHADDSQRLLYHEEAAKIDAIQREILQIAKTESAYDIFISYKEKAMDGSRTRSSVYAQDLYNRLTKEGYRVFFSRISLEDKVGQKYEPYIYSALNTSKVMLVVGTSMDEFMAPWVHNEWSRFLTMMREDTGKLLIPCFREMDAYDLPEEFQVLQCQDMTKIGFEQDLVRGIQKVCVKKAESPAVGKQANAANPTTNSMVQRMFICLEDSEFDKAEELADRVLDSDPRNANAYLGKLLIEYHCRSKEDLRKLERLLDSSNNYRHVLDYGDAELVDFCKNVNQEIAKKLEKQRAAREEEERKRKKGIAIQENKTRIQRNHELIKAKENKLAELKQEKQTVDSQIEQDKKVISLREEQLKKVDKNLKCYNKWENYGAYVTAMSKKKGMTIILLIIVGLFLLTFLLFHSILVWVMAVTDLIACICYARSLDKRDNISDAWEDLEKSNRVLKACEAKEKELSDQITLCETNIKHLWEDIHASEKALEELRQ